MQINSLNNERVKNWCKLNIKKYRDRENLFLVEGEHLVNEAIKCNAAKEIILLEGSTFNTDLPVYEVTESIMKKITNQVSISNICAVCHKLEENDIKGNVIMLDEVQDPGNLGTIIRSASAFNADTIVLSENTVDLYNDKVIRSSEGMIFHVNIIKRNLCKIIDELQNQNYYVYGTKVDGGKNIKDIEKIEKFVLIIGNEGQGVSDEIKDFSDYLIRINMPGNAESLNASIAAGILMYKFSEN